MLQAEIGYTTNEPPQLAVREAIESAVIHLTVQGIRDRIFEMRDENQWSDPVIQTYLKEQDDSLAEVAGTDDDEIPMRTVTPETRVSPVYPLLTKESAKELPHTKVSNSPPPQTNSANSGMAVNKISDKDDIFDIYRKTKN